MLMRYGVIITGGSVADQVDLARSAEEAGWDGVFTWDGIHVGDDVEVHDPWVLMAAFAMRTQRVRLGAIVMPLARRRPWKVAREVATLDLLSQGRLILPVGLGAVDDSAFGRVGEPTDRRTRAQRLDETLAILEGLGTGEPFGFEGRHYRFAPMRFRPTPRQRPRVPIWTVGAWPSERSMSRVLRYDGLLPHALVRRGAAGAAGGDGGDGGEGGNGGEGGDLTPALVAEMRDWIAARRSLAGFDIVVEGKTPAGDRAAAVDLVRPWASAGATWWIEADWSSWEVAPARARIRAGPPRAEQRSDTAPSSTSGR